jgi:hypothetical protein
VRSSETWVSGIARRGVVEAWLAGADGESASSLELGIRSSLSVLPCCSFMTRSRTCEAATSLGEFSRTWVRRPRKDSSSRCVFSDLLKRTNSREHGFDSLAQRAQGAALSHLTLRLVHSGSFSHVGHMCIELWNRLSPVHALGGR